MSVNMCMRAWFWVSVCFLECVCKHVYNYVFYVFLDVCLWVGEFVSEFVCARESKCVIEWVYVNVNLWFSM